MQRWLKTAQALAYQQAGLRLLSLSAVAGGSAAARLGVLAAANLGKSFDLVASQAIDDGDVVLEVSPMDVVLGVLPLLPLALHFWFLGHVPSAAVTSPVVTAAEKMVFVRNGQLGFVADLITLKEARPEWTRRPARMPST